MNESSLSGQPHQDRDPPSSDGGERPETLARAIVDSLEELWLWNPKHDDHNASAGSDPEQPHRERLRILLVMLELLRLLRAALADGELLERVRRARSQVLGRVTRCWVPLDCVPELSQDGGLSSELTEKVKARVADAIANRVGSPAPTENTPADTSRPSSAQDSFKSALDAILSWASEIEHELIGWLDGETTFYEDVLEVRPVYDPLTGETWVRRPSELAHEEFERVLVWIQAQTPEFDELRAELLKEIARGSEEDGDLVVDEAVESPSTECPTHQETRTPSTPGLTTGAFLARVAELRSRDGSGFSPNPADRRILLEVAKWDNPLSLGELGLELTGPDGKPIYRGNYLKNRCSRLCRAGLLRHVADPGPGYVLTDLGRETVREIDNARS